MSHLSNVWIKATELSATSGSGSILTTTDGTEYLDFTSGMGTLNLGHCHPAVTEAISEQAGRLVHAHANIVTHDAVDRLAERLAAHTPDSIDRFFFALSGDDVTEAAVKMAKQATGRPNVIVFDGGFHGRTHLGMAMSSVQNIYRFGHEPLPSGIFIAPFPDPIAADQAESIADTLRAFDRILLTQTAPAETAAVVIEPILGEGGIIPAPRAFLEGIAERCRAHGILFIADEVTTGFGRTGSWFAVDGYDIEPDAIMMSKGMASGFPMAALGLRADLDDLWPTGSHSGTYGGSPLGCAAALATIDAMEADGFFDAVDARGKQLKEGLSRLKEVDPSIRQVRGPGLMIGVGFEQPDRVPAILEHCRHEGRLLLLTCGGNGSVVRWLPPLTVTSDEIRDGVAAFETALKATL